MWLFSEQINTLFAWFELKLTKNTMRDFCSFNFISTLFATVCRRNNFTL